jgi:L-serine dehydratase
LHVSSLSTFDIFKIGIGPSSSHTMGPWRAAQRFVDDCRRVGVFDRIERVRVELFGSLAKTGHGHGTDLAVVLGLAGADPVTCDPRQVHADFLTIRLARSIRLAGTRLVPFDPNTDIVFSRSITLPFHPNALTFTATLANAASHAETYYSIGGGFVVREGETEAADHAAAPPLPFQTASELLAHCRSLGQTIAQVVRRNELTWRRADEVSAGLEQISRAMVECAFRGCQAEGVLPGRLGVVRRAGRLSRSLLGGRIFESVDEWLAAIRQAPAGFADTLRWVSAFALGVNEENAAYGRVVTAPTNGAAGVVPAVLLYYNLFCAATPLGTADFLLAAAAVGALFKHGATISAAMGGCQAEIGVSSAMAAAGLTEVLGGSPDQVLMAAEIAMEHHLGLTCDPVGGLVQIPCIERNTMGAVKAITASQIALASDPAAAKVSLDAVVRSMWETARDMSSKYKETAEGGLALQIPVNVIEC